MGWPGTFKEVTTPGVSSPMFSSKYRGVSRGRWVFARALRRDGAIGEDSSALEFTTTT